MTGRKMSEQLAPLLRVAAIVITGFIAIGARRGRQTQTTP